MGKSCVPQPHSHTHRHPTAEVSPILVHTVVSLKNFVTTTAPFHSSWILECSMGAPTKAGTLHKHSSSFLRLAGDSSLLTPHVPKAHLHDIPLITLKSLHSECNSQEVAQGQLLTEVTKTACDSVLLTPHAFPHVTSTAL